MDSIIFDLDGTLWNSIDTVLIAWNKIINQDEQLKGDLTRNDFKGTMGLQIEEIGKILFPYKSENERKKRLKECCDLETLYLEQHGGQLYENVESVLDTLSQQYKLYIVSNCQEGYIEAFYKYHKLDRYFLDYENPGRTGLSKGENIKLVIERNSLKNPVYVGDTEGDLRASKYAGIPFIYVAYGFGEVDEYDYVIKEFDELLNFFLKILSR
ncbi:HAD family hydrolase [Piscibacillus sp. B03]|uniref:HAD family hydrolase n=1 Tax=Piscibacillus sp. B03 TaxID=3457430 RepID=UPI003FCEA3DA